MPSPPVTADCARTALFLDVDGTLLEIRDRPEDVVADAGLVDLLETLSSAFGGALSLISGRSIAQIDRIFAPARFAAAGAHAPQSVRADKRNHFVRHAGRGRALHDDFERSGLEASLLDQLPAGGVQHRLVRIAGVAYQAGRQLDDTRVQGPAVLFHQHDLAFRRGGHQNCHRVGVGARNEFPVLPFDEAEVPALVTGDVIVH